MNIKKREKPLESLESICNRNGIFFDKTKPYKPIRIVSEDGSSFLLDSHYNMFDTSYTNMRYSADTSYSSDCDKLHSFYAASITCTISSEESGTFDTEPVRNSGVFCIVDDYSAANVNTPKNEMEYRIVNQPKFQRALIKSVA